MILSDKAIGMVEDYIEDVELCEDNNRDISGEIEVDGLILYFTFTVFSHFVEEYNIHNEFAYNNVENLSHYEFDGAEITELGAYDEDGEEVEISNKEDIRYW